MIHNLHDWFFAVLERDDWCCQNCLSETNLDAAHIIPRSRSRALRLAASNGVTLCRRCHQYFSDRPAMFDLWIASRRRP